MQYKWIKKEEILRKEEQGFKQLKILFKKLLNENYPNNYFYYKLKQIFYDNSSTIPDSLKTTIPTKIPKN